MPAPVLIVFGCSAVGKSAVSRLLAGAVTPSVDTCLERSRRRDPTGPPDFQGFRSLHAKFVDLGHREAHAIDASGPAQQVANAVLSAFRDGRLAIEREASNE